MQRSYAALAALMALTSCGSDTREYESPVDFSEREFKIDDYEVTLDERAGVVIREPMTLWTATRALNQLKFAFAGGCEGDEERKVSVNDQGRTKVELGECIVGNSSINGFAVSSGSDGDGDGDGLPVLGFASFSGDIDCMCSFKLMLDDVSEELTGDFCGFSLSDFPLKFVRLPPFSRS